MSITLIVVIGLLPHHHHHGQPCWFIDVCAEHEHDPNMPEQKDCPADPCQDDVCFLQSMKTFMQAEQPAADRSMQSLAALPDFFYYNPAFIYISRHKNKPKAIGLTQKRKYTHALRGPPTA